MFLETTWLRLTHIATDEDHLYAVLYSFVQPLGRFVKDFTVSQGTTSCV